MIKNDQNISFLKINNFFNKKGIKSSKIKQKQSKNRKIDEKTIKNRFF